MLLLLASIVFMRPVTAMKPVMTPSGEYVRQPDGRIQKQEDKWRTFMANWDAHLMLGAGAACLLWAAGRATVGFIRRDSNSSEKV